MNELEYVPISDSDSVASMDVQDEFVEEKTNNDSPAIRSKLDDSSLDDCDNCPICFDPWTSTGPHKLCCLRCGHLFGFSCVVKWIKSQGRQARCPQCNRKAVRHDIRFLYTKNLRAIDTSERDRALSDLAVERAARHKAEHDLAEHKARNQLLLMEIAQLRDELGSVQAVSQALSSAAFRHQSSDPQQSGHFDLCKSIPISPTGNCRVMASCDYLNLLCVSQPSSNPIFRGFGIRKVHTIEQRPLKYIHLHQQPLRDIAFHPDAQDGILISASMDKTVRLTSLLSDQVVQTYQCDAPVWSCCWSSSNPNQLFAGCSNGSVMMFDVRVTSGPVSTLAIPDSNSPVIGLQYVHQSFRDSTFLGSGLLVGQLTKVTFMMEDPDSPSLGPTNLSDPVDFNESDHQEDGSHSPDLFHTNPIQVNTTNHLQFNMKYTPYNLPLEGNLASLSLVPGGRHFLASYRPSQRVPRVRHLLAELVRENASSMSAEPPAFSDVYTCKEVHSLWAGSRMKMLTRARLFTISDAEPSHSDQVSSMLVVAGSEDINGALVWRCDTGTRLQTLFTPDTSTDSPIIDCCSFRTTLSSQPSLALLSERTVHLYRWITGT